MAARRLLLILLPLLALAGPAPADQNDPDLDILFGRLQTTPSAHEARVLEAGIWRLWLRSDSPTVNLLMEQGVNAMSEGRREESLGVFDTVTKLAPEFAEGWNKRATVLFMLGRLRKSIADCAKVLALEPRHFGALGGLGLIYTRLEKPEKALDAYRRLLEINPHATFARRQIKLLEKQIKGEKI